MLLITIKTNLLVYLGQAIPKKEISQFRLIVKKKQEGGK